MIYINEKGDHYSSRRDIIIHREGGSLFIGFRGVIGTFLLRGLLTDFKRKLDLTVVAIPPNAGMRMR